MTTKCFDKIIVALNENQSAFRRLRYLLENPPKVEGTEALDDLAQLCKEMKWANSKKEANG